MKVAELLIYQNLVLAIYVLMGYILHKKKIVLWMETVILEKCFYIS